MTAISDNIHGTLINKLSSNQPISSYYKGVLLEYLKLSGYSSILSAFDDYVKHILTGNKLSFISDFQQKGIHEKIATYITDIKCLDCGLDAEHTRFPLKTDCRIKCINCLESVKIDYNPESTSIKSLFNRYIKHLRTGNSKAEFITYLNNTYDLTDAYIGKIVDKTCVRCGLDAEHTRFSESKPTCSKCKNAIQKERNLLNPEKIKAKENARLVFKENLEKQKQETKRLKETNQIRQALNKEKFSYNTINSLLIPYNTTSLKLFKEYISWLDNGESKDDFILKLSLDYGIRKPIIISYIINKKCTKCGLDAEHTKFKTHGHRCCDCNALSMKELRTTDKYKIADKAFELKYKPIKNAKRRERKRTDKAYAEKIKRYNLDLAAKNCAELTDYYVKSVLVKESRKIRREKNLGNEFVLSTSDISPEMIRAKRLILIIRRLTQPKVMNNINKNPYYTEQSNFLNLDLNLEL